MNSDRPHFKCSIATCDWGLLYRTNLVNRWRNRDPQVGRGVAGGGDRKPGGGASSGLGEPAGLRPLASAKARCNLSLPRRLLLELGPGSCHPFPWDRTGPPPPPPAPRGSCTRSQGCLLALACLLGGVEGTNASALLPLGQGSAPRGAFGVRAPGGDTGSGTARKTAQTAPSAPAALFYPLQNKHSSQTSPLVS